MKRISLITLHFVQNYGSVLQTYASQTLFEKLGYEAETVDYVRENNKRENIVETGILNSKFWSKNLLTRTAFKLLKAGDLYRRYDMFEGFVKDNIKLSEHRYYSDKDFEKYPVVADIYCSGSDQIWNSYWNRGILSPFYLSYAPKGARKVAYAASFGKASLDEGEKPEIRALLSDYEHITVREKEAVDILREMGIGSQRVLDPTLMLSGDEWREFADKPLIDGDYICVYELGYSKRFNDCAKALAKKKNIKLVRIGFGSEAYMYGGKVVKNPTVKGFLSLLANARYILTDSFHATSFAVNLNVPFFTFLPRTFSGRITDFLELTGLGSRIFDSYETLERLYEEEIDFAEVNEIVEKERKKSLTAVESMLEQRVSV